MRRLLIDNNIWAASEKAYPDVVNFLVGAFNHGDLIYMSRIIHMELLSFYEIDTNEKIKQSRNDIIKCVDEFLEVDEEVALKAAEIRRTAKLNGKSAPKGPDAIIAATACLNDLILVSNNDKDFVWASEQYGFNLLNPVTDKDDYKTFCDQYEAKKKAGL